MKLTTTLNLLKKKGLNLYENTIGHDYDHDEPINLLTILEIYGIYDFLRVFIALEQDWSEVKPILINIVTDIEESVRSIMLLHVLKIIQSNLPIFLLRPIVMVESVIYALKLATLEGLEKQKQIDIIKKYLTWE